MTYQKVLNIYKPVSLTPLQMIDKLRLKYPELKDETLAYAGRLDPMAEGVLLVLIGDECKKRKEYERLSKVYEVEILWGISTDTYDVMGIVDQVILDRSNIKHKTFNKNINKKSADTNFFATWDVVSGVSSPDRGPTGALKNSVSNFFKSFICKHTQFYPPFSSVRVKGKPLYYWARENKLDEIEIPSKEIEIFDIRYLKERYIHSDELFKNITERISKVDGNFRQEEILEKWNQTLKPLSRNSYLLTSIRVSCSSGTYMRSLAHEIGKKLGIPSLAYSIKRNQVGNFSIKESALL